MTTGEAGPDKTGNEVRSLFWEMVDIRRRSEDVQVYHASGNSRRDSERSGEITDRLEGEFGISQSEVQPLVTALLHNNGDAKEVLEGFLSDRPEEPEPAVALK